jgi:hypothetical protein
MAGINSDGQSVSRIVRTRRTTWKEAKMKIKSNVRAGYYDRCGGYTRCGGYNRCSGSGPYTQIP